MTLSYCVVTILQSPAAPIRIAIALPISKAKTDIVHDVVLILFSLPCRVPFIVHNSEFPFSDCRPTKNIL